MDEHPAVAVLEHDFDRSTTRVRGHGRPDEVADGMADGLWIAGHRRRVHRQHRTDLDAGLSLDHLPNDPGRDPLYEDRIPRQCGSRLGICHDQQIVDQASQALGLLCDGIDHLVTGGGREPVVPRQHLRPTVDGRHRSPQLVGKRFHQLGTPDRDGHGRALIARRPQPLACLMDPPCTQYSRVSAASPVV